MSSDAPNGDKRRVAYLIGAGGSHACVDALGIPHGILMKDLTPDLVDEVKKRVQKDSAFAGMSRVVNQIVTEEADVEHLITFFDESPSAVHRKFADALRQAFEVVLKKRLATIGNELEEDCPDLYAALFDMYNIDNIDETLHGVLTLNYDSYIESAAEKVNDRQLMDLAFCTDGPHQPLLLKLHGSFSWEDSWPLRRSKSDKSAGTLWIPPGIRKGKERYPFNMIWGQARDVLNCNILRVIGCRLGPSDWDLISLLFSTQNVNDEREQSYAIEIIDSPERAECLKKS